MIETNRLILREFNLQDASFIYRLVNTESWLSNIGDKQVRSVADAETYIKDGPLKSYHEHGYGGWVVALKEALEPIGQCGFYKRDYLDAPDIGYALLPEYWGKGYAFEAAAAALKYLQSVQPIQKLYGICSPSNSASIKLLKRLELSFIESREEDEEVVAVYRRDFTD